MSIYCLDTSSLIRGFIESYPQETFVGFWERIDELIDDKRIVSCQRVLAEIEVRSDKLKEWTKKRKQIFNSPSEERQKLVREIQAKHPHLVKAAGTSRSGADPWVIALAKMTPDCILITEEGMSSNTKPKIPNVCIDYGIAYERVLKMIQREGWKFQRI